MTREHAQRWSWIVGIVGLLFALLGWLLEPVVFPYAWLAALTAWIGWPLGCMALLLVHVLTGGRWGETLRPYLLVGIGTLPLLLPAIVPLLLVLPRLYPWLHPGFDLPNNFYLNAPFAMGRGIVYLIVWFGLGAMTIRPEPPSAPFAVIGLILLALTVTFAAIDATMSLDPHFISSDYGMIAGAEGGLLAISICILGAALDAGLPRATFDDLGRLLQGLLVLWAYLDFMQFLIVWQSDLPHESAWYIARSTGGWGIMAGIVALGHFVLPFFALMSPRVRSSRAGIGAIAALLVAMEILRAWWLVLPAAHRAPSWIDVAAMLAIGGLSTALALSGPGMFMLRPRVRHG